MKAKEVEPIQVEGLVGRAVERDDGQPMMQLVLVGAQYVKAELTPQLVAQLVRVGAEFLEARVVR